MLDWLRRLLGVPDSTNGDRYDGPTFGAARSPKWASLRAAVLREEQVCRACGTRADLEVHHIRPFHLYPELEVVRSNLMALCRTDHLIFGHLRSWSAWNPHVEADVAFHRSCIERRPTRRKP